MEDLEGDRITVRVRGNGEVHVYAAEFIGGTAVATRMYLSPEMAYDLASKLMRAASTALRDPNRDDGPPKWMPTG